MRSYDLEFRWDEMYLPQEDSAQQFDHQTYNNPELRKLLESGPSPNNQHLGIDSLLGLGIGAFVHFGNKNACSVL